MWNYSIPLLTAVLALLQLFKDWGAHKATWRRAAVLLLIVGLGIGGVVNATKNDNKNREQTGTIKALTTAVETANQNQAKNTAIYVESLERLSAKLSMLEANVKTADLHSEAAQLRSELSKTQKALDIPTAVLSPGIFDQQKPDQPSVLGFATVSSGQPVQFEISLWNHSGTSARRGSLFIRICKVCSFHSEIPGSKHNSGQLALEREIEFPQLPTEGRLQTFHVELDVPHEVSYFEIGFRYFCENCAENKSWRTAAMRVTRLGLKPVGLTP
jgi:hypothetical protein